jgi:hypothetical protein
VLLNIPYTARPTSDRSPANAYRFAGLVGSYLEKQKVGWNGVVLDLSAITCTQALEVMDGLSANVHPAPLAR